MKRGYEHLAGVGQEPFASHWPVEDHRCRHAECGQGADERCRLPVAVRDRCAQAFTPRRASMQTRHFVLAEVSSMNTSMCGLRIPTKRAGRTALKRATVPT